MGRAAGFSGFLTAGFSGFLTAGFGGFLISRSFTQEAAGFGVFSGFRKKFPSG